MVHGSPYGPEHSSAAEATNHTVSATAWIVDSPVVAGRSLRVKVGVSCPEKCSLAGRVEIRGEEGALAVHGQLGVETWPGTEGLFVATLEMRAPEREGVSHWSAVFTPEAGDGLHGRASVLLTFRTAAPPDHTVVVRVVEKDSRSPVSEVLVHAGGYQAVTDDAGFARIALPKGKHELKARRVGYAMRPVIFELDADTGVDIEAAVVPEADELWM